MPSEWEAYICLRAGPDTPPPWRPPASAWAILNMYASSSRCCFCHFDSITVIIMEGTAPDNYTIKKNLFIVNPATDKLKTINKNIGFLVSVPHVGDLTSRLAPNPWGEWFWFVLAYKNRTFVESGTLPAWCHLQQSGSNLHLSSGHHSSDVTTKYLANSAPSERKTCPKSIQHSKEL